MCHAKLWCWERKTIFLLFLLRVPEGTDSPWQKSFLMQAPKWVCVLLEKSPSAIGSESDLANT